MDSCGAYVLLLYPPLLWTAEKTQTSCKIQHEGGLKAYCTMRAMGDRICS